MTIIAALMMALWITMILGVVIAGLACAQAPKVRASRQDLQPIAIIVPGKYGGVKFILVASEATRRLVHRRRIKGQRIMAQLSRVRNAVYTVSERYNPLLRVSNGPSRRQARQSAHAMRTGPTGGGHTQSIKDKAYHASMLVRMEMAHMAKDRRVLRDMARAKLQKEERYRLYQRRLQAAEYEKLHGYVNEHGVRRVRVGSAQGAYRNGGAKEVYGPHLPKAVLAARYKAKEETKKDVVSFKVVSKAVETYKPRFKFGADNLNTFLDWKERAYYAASQDREVMFDVIAQEQAWLARAPKVARALKVASC